MKIVSDDDSLADSFIASLLALGLLLFWVVSLGRGLLFSTDRVLPWINSDWACRVCRKGEVIGDTLVWPV